MSIIGIDFGTSNSLAAIVRNGAVKLVEFDGLKSTPTVLFFPEVSLLKKSGRNYFFGRKAIEERYDEDNYGRLVFSFKGLLADHSFDGTLVSGHGRFTAEMFCSYFLSKIKAVAEEQFNEKFESVVLGRPVEFDELAATRLRNAAIEAGFKQVYFQMEPIAAALSYEKTLTPDDGEQIVFVCDIGGGTSDYAVVRLSALRSKLIDRSSDILATGGIYKAGESFNSLVAKERLGERFGKGAIWGSKKHPFPIHWIQALGNWRTLPFLRREQIGRLVADTEEARQKDVQRLEDLVSNNLGYRLYSSIDEAKVQLSSETESDITLRQIELNETITRSEFEGLIAPIMDEMTEEMVRTLDKSRISLDNINKVILTGGSSLVPAVRNKIVTLFGEHKIISIDTFNSVVAGLAIQAGHHEE